MRRAVVHIQRQRPHRPQRCPQRPASLGHRTLDLLRSHPTHWPRQPGEWRGVCRSLRYVQRPGVEPERLKRRATPVDRTRAIGCNVLHQPSGALQRQQVSERELRRNLRAELNAGRCGVRAG